MAVNVFTRMGGNIVGYGGPISAGVYYFGWMRETMARVLSEEMDPIVVGAVLGEVGAVAVGATLEHNGSRLPDGVQRALGRTAGAVLGAVGGVVTASRTGEHRYISAAFSGGAAGYIGSDITSRAAPYWGNLAHERSEEKAHLARP
jgi:hypothetical protein